MQEKSSDILTEALAQKILRGELAPGEKLRQDHIAQEFGLSHVPVREALLRLEAKGLAVSRPRQGMRVAPLDDSAQKELRVMREALEPVALAHSVPHLSAAQIAHAEGLRLACDEAEDMFTWEALNRDFHLATIAACAMPRLIEEVTKLQLLAARYMLQHYRQRWKKHIDIDHRAIMAAIRRRDAQAAAAVLERHLARLG
ncbi:GntR family transcriptional regulator [Paracoccus aminophilus]|uniref:Transcriptional regulator, GntR family n=1 Tax=Paracoccus aminophilus JCM 7686 TaxID=1367847 RepID=S5YS93_PARAH|nr:GntR family transcriptional regulator [Paracoccus aminophilus]AGT08076.1 transcriptional regulator, GntR family [Paracoccus aminophilus JCM 7686]